MDRRGFCQKLLGSGLALGGLVAIGSAQTADGKLKWHKSLKAAHKLAIETDKPMLIVFGASWCHFCHKLERETLADKRMVAAMKGSYRIAYDNFIEGLSDDGDMASKAQAVEQCTSWPSRFALGAITVVLVGVNVRQLTTQYQAPTRSSEQTPG